MAEPSQNTSDGLSATEDKTTKTSRHYLENIEWLARHFSKTFSKEAVASALPEGFDRRDPAILPRALSVVGLKSSFVERDLKDIDPITFPCLIFHKKTGIPLLLVSFSQNRKFARVINLSKGDFEEEIPTKKLRGNIERSILLVSTKDEATARRLDPESRSTFDQNRHWLWGPIFDNWNGLTQILVGALGINLFALAVPIFVMNVYDRVIPNLAFVTLWTLAIGVAIAIGTDTVLRIIRTNIIDLLGRRVDVTVNANLFQHAMGIKMLARPGGAASMVNRLREFEMVRDFFTSASFVAVIDLLFIGIFIAVLWVIVGPIALVPMLSVPAVIIIALLAQIPIGRGVKESQELAVKRHIVLVESLLGTETVKSLGGEPVMQREWENAVAASARMNGKTRFWSNFAASSTSLIQQLVSIVIILWGVYLVAEGSITVGGLIAANILSGRILAPLSNITNTLIRAQFAIKAYQSLNEVMELESEHGSHVRSDLRVKNASLECRNISFSYPGAQVGAIEKLSLNVAPGETIALLGRVGSGKSTLGRLMNGLLEPAEGIILVDGHESNQYERAELRRGIGYLPQDPELFTGTMRENLILGKTDATDGEIAEALYYSGMDAFVAQNPEGLNHFIGEKGSRLSGGQRQGLSLARLLLRKPKLMFLDEPTNAMDNQTEAQVIARLGELKKKGTSLILCTHRLSLAEIAERYVVIERGVKVMDGPKAEVMAALKSGQLKVQAPPPPPVIKPGEA